MPAFPFEGTLVRYAHVKIQTEANSKEQAQAIFDELLYKSDPDLTRCLAAAAVIDLTTEPDPEAESGIARIAEFLPLDRDGVLRPSLVLRFPRGETGPDSPFWALGLAVVRLPGTSEPSRLPEPGDGRGEPL